MKLSSLLVLAASVAVVALGLAGCGDDDESTAAPTKAEFVEQGDAILCTKTEEVAAATAGVDPSASRKELEALVSQEILPAVQKAYDDLSAVEPPDGDEEEVSAILAEFRSGIEATEADPAQLVTGPDPFAKADGLVADYGLSGECPSS